MFETVKVHIRFLETYTYFRGVAAAKLWQHLPNMNVIKYVAIC